MNNFKNNTNLPPFNGGGNYMNNSNHNYPNQQQYPSQQGFLNPQGQQQQGHFNQQGVPNYQQGYQQHMHQPPFNSQQNNKDDFLQNEYNKNGYNEIEQGSMEEFYEYKKNKTKIIVLLIIASILFIFILGIFTTPFINGKPLLMDEQSRQVIYYSEKIKEKTIGLFKDDDYYYDLANKVALNVVKADISIDDDISSDISKMETLRKDLEIMDKSNSVPVGFDGKNGLHHQMIALVDLRIKQLSDLRLITQGQSEDILLFNKNFEQYISHRDNVVTSYNNKYDANYHKTLFEMKELEFNVQEK